MKAVYISEPGGPEMLEIREVPAPVPVHGEVLIDVVAAGVNRADVHQRVVVLHVAGREQRRQEQGIRKLFGGICEVSRMCSRLRQKAGG